MTWRAMVSERKRLRGIIHHVIANFTHAYETKGFRAWSGAVAAVKLAEEDAERRQVAFERCQKRWLHQRSGAAYRRWQEFISERKHARQVIVHVCGKLLHGYEAKGFRAWHEAVEAQKHHEDEERRRARLLEKAKRRWLHAGLNAAFRSWELYWTHRKQLRHLATSTVNRMMNTLLFPAFRSWHETVVYERHNEVVLARCRAKWLLGTQSRSLASWKEMVSERKRLRLMLVRAAAFMVHGVLAPGFRRWRVEIDRQKEEERLDQQDRYDELVGRLAKREEELKKQMEAQQKSAIARASSMFAAWAGKSVSAAWFAWSSGFRARKERQKELLVHAVRLFKHATVNSALQSWKAFREHRHRCRQLINHAVARFAAGSISPAFHSWVLFVKDMDRHEAEEKRKEQLLARFKQRMLHTAELKAFQGWLHGVQERVRLRQLIKHAVARFTHGKLAPAMRTWCVFTDRSKSEEAASHQRELAVERCRRRLKNVLAGKAWNAWRENVSERKRLRGLIKHAVARFTHGKLAPAMKTWVSAVEGFRQAERDAERREKTLDRIRRRILHSASASAFQAWIFMVEERKRMRVLVHRTMTRFTKGTYATAFWTWWHVSEALGADESRKERLEALKGRIALRMKHSGLIKSFGSWEHFVWERKRLRDLVHRTVNRFLHAEVAPALRSWVVFVEAQKAEEQDDLRKEALIQQVRKRMLHGCIFKALNQWIHTTHERQRMRNLVRKVMGRLVSGKVAAGFGSWAALVAFEKRNAVILERFGRKLRLSLAHKSMESWKHLWADRKKLRGEMGRILHRLLHSNLVPAFNSWKFQVEYAKRVEVIVRRAAMKFLYSSPRGKFSFDE